MPNLPANGVSSAEGWLALPGAAAIDHGSVSPGPDASTYAFAKVENQRNLFRIPVH
jgi:hypothetical protein